MFYVQPDPWCFRESNWTTCAYFWTDETGKKTTTDDEKILVVTGKNLSPSVVVNPLQPEPILPNTGVWWSKLWCVKMSIKLCSHPKWTVISVQSENSLTQNAMANMVWQQVLFCFFLGMIRGCCCIGYSCGDCLGQTLRIIHLWNLHPCCKIFFNQISSCCSVQHIINWPLDNCGFSETDKHGCFC